MHKNVKVKILMGSLEVVLGLASARNLWANSAVSTTVTTYVCKGSVTPYGNADKSLSISPGSVISPGDLVFDQVSLKDYKSVSDHEIQYRSEVLDLHLDYRVGEESFSTERLLAESQTESSFEETRDTPDEANPWSALGLYSAWRSVRDDEVRLSYEKRVNPFVVLQSAHHQVGAENKIFVLSVLHMNERNELTPKFMGAMQCKRTGLNVPVVTPP